MNRARVALIAAAVAFAAPGDASAGVLEKVDFGVEYHAAAGESNDVVAEVHGYTMTLTDTAGLTYEGTPGVCDVVDADTLTCRTNRFGGPNVDFHLGDGRDSFKARGDTMRGAFYDVYGEAGDDVIDIRNGTYDEASCRAGDVVIADRLDRIWPSCRIDYGDRGNAPAVAIEGPGRVRESGRGNAFVPLSCPAGGPDCVAGWNYVTPHKLLSEHYNVRIAAGHSVKINLALRYTARDNLKAGKPVSGTLWVVNRDGHGASHTSSRRISVVANRPRGG